MARWWRYAVDPGAADWLVVGRGLCVVYNWPNAGDTTSALVVNDLVRVVSK
jgi:hypothetical protein